MPRLIGRYTYLLAAFGCDYGVSHVKILDMDGSIVARGGPKYVGILRRALHDSPSIPPERASNQP